jgi:hypothetical protein
MNKYIIIVIIIIITSYEQIRQCLSSSNTVETKWESFFKFRRHIGLLPLQITRPMYFLIYHHK